MCPACIATATVAWLAAGTTSTGGMAALVVSRLRGKNNKNNKNNKNKESDMTTQTTEIPRTEMPKVETPKVVSSEAWLAARKDLLAKEKEFNRQRDALSAERRKLPMVRIEKDYVFDGPNGPRTLADLFEGRRQLIIYHFMFDPAWEQGCKSCSFVADSFAGSVVHLAARDTSFAVISRAPLAKIEPFKQRMGWTFPWLSSNANDFNYDFHVTLDDAHPEYNYRPNYLGLAKELKRGPQAGEAPGLSVFLRDGEHVYHTYSTYTRGLDLFLNAYNLLDHTPVGRHEDGKGMSWLRHHDKY